jgi:hypothetical protein
LAVAGSAVANNVRAAKTSLKLKVRIKISCLFFDAASQCRMA